MRYEDWNVSCRQGTVKEYNVGEDWPPYLLKMDYDVFMFMFVVLYILHFGAKTSPNRPYCHAVLLYCVCANKPVSDGRHQETINEINRSNCQM